ncbi:MAG: ABC transporter substrate-binding protein [Desulfobacteraceae bacterium]|jgi:branched-chain amino acid transport system substrate-binding protein
MKGNYTKTAISILAFILCLSMAPGDNALAADSIRIGWTADMPGVGATFYASQKKALELFIEETNAAGGILGKKLELIIRDSKLKPDVGATMARELVLSEKCDFLIGPTSSGVALAVSKVAKEFKKIVYFHTSNTNKLTTTDFHPYMFQVVPHTGIEGRGIAMFLAKSPYKRICFIGPDYAYGHTQWEAFKDYLVKIKPDVQILKAVWPKQGETNYGPYIPTLMAQNPEVIYTNLWGGSLSSFIKQAKPYGLFKKSTITSLFDLDLMRAAGKDMPEGLLGYARCPFYAVGTLDMKIFVDKYHTKYNEWPSDWACMAYDGMIALTTAIEKANSIDSDDVVKALEGLRYASLRGSRYIRAEDHMANVGIYVGYTSKDAKYENFLILKDVVEVPAEKVWLSVEGLKSVQPK